MKIYTRTGDGGETGLYGGGRRPKSDVRIAAYGEVDELQAALGLVRAQVGTAQPLNNLLKSIQSDCFVLSCELARTATKPERKDPVLTADRVAYLEQEIDQASAALPELTAFILPGGSVLGAELHLARTICRRAERGVVALAQAEAISPLLPQYLNRLSDLLFVLARQANQEACVPEEEWHP